MKKTLVAIASSMLLATSAWVGTAYAADTAPKIAVVNVQQIFQQSAKIADLNKKLQGEFKSRQDKLVALQKTLQDELEKYKKESPTMSEKDKSSLQKKIVDDQAKLTKDATAFQQDLSKEQGKVMKNVIGDLNKIISSNAKKAGYTLVLDSQAVVYSNDGFDITKDVAKEFDGQ